ncbi:MAG: MEMAR_RS02690 family S-layer glycoprotein [Methanoregula sp.]|uniref:MEMAR_RS02690 family S-layer glycoprotein n=1 Tax=Methanoregula sp. TaxID=2052170 RepID=UPI003D0D6930
MTKRLTIALIALVALVLVAVLPASATYYQVNNTINQGATVYIGEQQLNLSPLAASIAPNTIIGHWNAGDDPSSTQPANTVDLSTANINSYSVDAATYGNYPGLYYPVNKTTGFANGSVAINAKDPSLSVDVWDLNTSQIVTGASVIQGDALTFRIQTNLNEVYLLRSQINSTGSAVAAPGNMDIRLKSDAGNIYNAVADSAAAGTTVSLTQVHVNQSTWYLGTANNQAPGTVLDAWNTGALYASSIQYMYPSGVYTVYVESRVNGMIDNYKPSTGGQYTGKTVSAAGTVTLASNTVSISANKDSVVRSKSFSVTVTGRPNTYYNLWIKGVSTMALGSYDNEPPLIAPNQVGVNPDPAGSAAAIAADKELTTASGVNNTAGQYYGGYQFQNEGSLYNLYANEGGTSANGAFATSVYAGIQMSASGTRTIMFTTDNMTKAQQYTIRVEQNFSGQFKSDEVQVQVEKGAVTIVAAGDQSYYLGEEVKFSGTNTESQETYLFIVGPNLQQYGSKISSSDPRNSPVTDGVTSTFQVADVLGDNTWSWKWGTSAVALDAGTYTVYAVSQPLDANSLSTAAYGTVSIIIKKPFISATASQSTVAQGDSVFITGTAQGQPSSGVMIWLLGKNYAGVTTTSVNSDSSFSYEIKKEATKTLYAGQYFIVAQHPMQNNQFDVYPAVTPGTAVSGMPVTASGVSVFTVNQTSGSLGISDSADFRLTGSGSLQGSDAAEALIEAINSANVDDTYTKLQILLEVPIITIDPVGDRHVGDKFTITATTNLAVDDDVLFEVYSSSFQPTQKSQSGEFSGASGTVKVTKGDNGLNKLSFDVDASTFKPDEYLVKASAVLQTATGTALFNVLEAQAPTATPTVAATTAAPITTVATAVPTTVATPTKTPTQPGFGALVALIGLGAVALLVVRRH